jgi:putative SOS response-associated peptidase YedK
MCGRARLSTDVSEIKLVFSIPPTRPTHISHRAGTSHPPTPTGRALRREDRPARSRGHAVEPHPVFAQGCQDRPLHLQRAGGGGGDEAGFLEAFRQRRCLVPLDGFYEWKKTATGKQAYAIGLAAGGLMAMAGLWENWRSPAGERVSSVTIVTTMPNKLGAELHDLKQVILRPSAWPMWAGAIGRVQGAARSLSSR